MNKTFQAFVAAVVAVVAVAGVGVVGCSQNQAGREQTATAQDPIIRHHMEYRSDLLRQRRQLAETYGATSEQVAQVDRQISLTDAAIAERREYLIRQEEARQTVQQMKSEARPEEPGTQ